TYYRQCRTVEADSRPLLRNRRRAAQVAKRIRTTLAAEKAQEEVGTGDEEDSRLLERHRRSPDLLVGQRGEAPETRRMDVEVVDGTRERREQQAEGAGEHECGEQVDRAVAAGKPVRLVLKRRPPEEEAGHEVA